MHSYAFLNYNEALIGFPKDALEDFWSKMYNVQQINFLLQVDFQ